ncbi:hypothetical protein GCM10007388_00130 [Pseudoduganella plicata]|uniref:Fimbrial assembly protein n=2 Tax=Pseudoduganella plicata TaxID=321984 RepID=A0AA87Y340_9BURK|nr:hypothetical protein GCM10007388_00130 [Pseudoduganella plicata]
MEAMNRLLAPRRRHGALPWLVAVLLAGAATQLAVDAWTSHQAAQREAATLGRLRQALYKPAPPAPSREEKERAKRWATLRSEREFRWYPVFQALERTGSTEIELLEFAPDKGNRSFVLRGEARDIDALLDYVGKVAAQPAFADVYLAHQKLMKRDALETQAFEIRGRVRQ